MDIEAFGKKNSLFTVLIKLFITVCSVIFYIHYFFPQSWGFFTIEPAQPLLNAYPVHNGEISKVPLIANNMSYGMGVSRKGIVLFNGLVKLIGANKNLSWRSLNEDSIQYIAHHDAYIEVTTDKSISFYRGNYLLIKTERPSAFVLKNNLKFLPAKEYLLVDVK
jgi:hypothetical protein